MNSPRDVEAVLAQETVDARHLQEVWAARETIPWLQDVALARRFIERALDAGELLLACAYSERGCQSGGAGAAAGAGRGAALGADALAPAQW